LRIYETMSVKSLAPIALGIGALYLFSTKGSPFEQQPRKPDAKPGGEHVGPPKPEPTLKELKKQDAGLRKLAGLTGEPYDDTDHINAHDGYTLTPIQKAIKKHDKQIAVYHPAVAPPPVQPAKPPTPAAINDPKAAGVHELRRQLTEQIYHNERETEREVRTCGCRDFPLGSGNFAYRERDKTTRVLLFALGIATFSIR